MAIGRKDYQDRKEARIDRLNARSQKAVEESTEAYDRAHEIASHIPMGQPILVGHHSERHARRDQEKIAQGMRKSIEADKRAGYYADRAQAAADNTAISSDDPEALDKLHAKLECLQNAQERGKALNAYYRKHKTLKGCDGVSDAEAEQLERQMSDQPERLRRPVPAWMLTNRNAEINRLKKRIERLQVVDAMEDAEIEFDGGRIVSNSDVNRVQILFDEKPDADMRQTLKSYGFRWAPSEGAWQIQRTPANLRRAKSICKSEGGAE